MRKYFWREKNSNSQVDKCQVVVPTRAELFDELIKKLYEKIEMIDVIFDKDKRQTYLQAKGKTIDKSIPEIVIQQKIGTRVIVDFLQLAKDVCEFKSIKKVNISQENKIEKEKIKSILDNAVSDLETNKKIEEGIALIYNAVLSLAKALSLEYETLEKERQKVENMEGSFLNGKYVVAD